MRGNIEKRREGGEGRERERERERERQTDRKTQRGVCVCVCVRGGGGEREERLQGINRDNKERRVGKKSNKYSEKVTRRKG